MPEFPNGGGGGGGGGGSGGGGGGGGPALTECNPDGLSLGGVIQEGSG